MKERTLALLLVLFTVVVLLAPVALALSSNNWSFREIIIPPQEDITEAGKVFDEVRDPGDFTVLERDIEPNQGDFEIYGQFDSSVDFDITLKGLNSDIYIEERDVGEISLKEETVKLESGKSTSFVLRGYTQDNLQLQNGLEVAEIEKLNQMRFENITIEAEFLGVNLCIKDYGQRGDV